MVHHAQYKDQVKDAVFGEPPWYSGTIQGELSMMDRLLVILPGERLRKALNGNGLDGEVTSVRTVFGMIMES